MTVFTLLAGLNLDPLPRVGVNGDGSIIQTILTFFWVLLGAISLIVITISGLKFVLSRGEPQAVAKAKNSIIYAAVGLIVALSAGVIVSFVFKQL
jgi:hypothetical protein